MGRRVHLSRVDQRFPPPFRLDPKPTRPSRMSSVSRAQTATDEAPHRFLPFLILLFVGSGCAALIYEIVWFQMLSLIVGSSAISLGVILGTFMGGMCIGSLFLSRVISRQQHPLRVYAMLEAGIAVLGVL